MFKIGDSSVNHRPQNKYQKPQIKTVEIATQTSKLIQKQTLPDKSVTEVNMSRACSTQDNKMGDKKPERDNEKPMGKNLSSMGEVLAAFYKSL